MFYFDSIKAIQNRSFVLTIALVVVWPSFSFSQSKGVEVREFRRETFNHVPYNDIFGIGIERHTKKKGKTVKIEYLTKDGYSAYLNGTSYPYYPHEYRFEYDRNGNILKKSALDSVGNIVDVDTYKEPAITEYKYDAEGRLSEVRRYDKDNKLVGIGDYGKSITKYAYDSEGRVSWVKSFQADGTSLLSHVSYSYTKDGDLQSQAYHRSDGSISSKFVFISFNADGEPLEVEDYNASGDLIGKFWFEYKNGNLVKETAWSSRSNEKQVSEPILAFEAEGWELNARKGLAFSFENYGQGEFKIAINKKGEITDAEPVDRIRGSERFKQEVFQYLRKVKLSRVGKAAEGEGVFRISILGKFPVKNPPYFE